MTPLTLTLRRESELLAAEALLPQIGLAAIAQQHQPSQAHQTRLKRLIWSYELRIAAAALCVPAAVVAEEAA